MKVRVRQISKTALRWAWASAVAMNAFAFLAWEANARPASVVWVFWSSGGPAPLSREVALYGDRSVVFRSADYKSHNARLTVSEFTTLQEDLASQELKSALSHLMSGDDLNSSDAQAVIFAVASQPEVGYDMCRDRPLDEAVVTFLRDLNNICAFHFKKLFRSFPLPSPCPELHGLRDTQTQGPVKRRRSAGAPLIGGG